MKEEIQGRFVKEYLKTYLILPYLSDTDEIYKLKMLENNNTKGMLEVELFIDGGAPFCKYAVGAGKSMELIFRTITIDHGKLLNVLKSFVTVFEETEELLLDPDDLVLKPELIFININDYKASFVYLPGYGTDISKQAEAFFEYMLNRVDYDDKMAVTLLYDCYVLVMKEERGISALKERIGREVPAPMRVLNTEHKEMAEEKDLIPSVMKPEPSLKSWLGGRFKKKKELEKNSVVNETENLFDDETKDTVLLAIRKEECNPCLVCTDSEEKIVVDNLPFVIGSLSGHTNYTPAKGKISRLHAEIKKGKEGMVLCDLNSTNGTKLNGENLIPGEEYSLYTNDRISFADVEYIYKEGISF